MRPLHGGWRRSALSVLASAGGSSLVLGLMVLMNAMEAKDDVNEQRTVSSFEVQRRAPPPSSKPKPRPKPKRKARSTAAPLPSLGPALSGVDFGLAGIGDALGDATQRLLGDVGDVVMNERSVDAAPKPVQRTAAQYPARARAKGVEGYVTVSMLVDAQGAVKDLRVLDARPAGVFDDVALAALRGWRFEPAKYDGRSVSVRVRQTLRFALE